MTIMVNYHSGMSNTGNFYPLAAREGVTQGNANLLQLGACLGPNLLGKSVSCSDDDISFTRASTRIFQTTRHIR